MKSPSITQLDDYLKSLKLYIVRNSHHKKLDPTKTSTPGHHQDLSSPSEHTPEPRETWTSVHDVPHMEISRRTITARHPNPSNENKPLQTTVLEIKTDKNNVQIIREAILLAKLSVRGHSIFIPTPFLKESPLAVYNTVA